MKIFAILIALAANDTISFDIKQYYTAFTWCNWPNGLITIEHFHSWGDIAVAEVAGAECTSVVTSVKQNWVEL